MRVANRGQHKNAYFPVVELWVLSLGDHTTPQNSTASHRRALVSLTRMLVIYLSGSLTTIASNYQHCVVRKREDPRASAPPLSVQRRTASHHVSH